MGLYAGEDEESDDWSKFEQGSDWEQALKTAKDKREKGEKEKEQEQGKRNIHSYLVPYSIRISRGAKCSKLRTAKFGLGPG